MPIPIFHSIASWFLKKRYYQIELFLNHPEEVQLEVLNQLVVTAKNTEIGILHDFDTIRGYNDFRNRVPIRAYEDIEPLITRARKGEKNIFWPGGIKWFAKSSGTTNDKSKYIPLSNEGLDNCHYKSGKDLLCLYLYNNENSKLFRGKNLRLGGSKELYEDNGTYFGDLSSILIDNMPLWAEFRSTPGSKVSLMQEWENKMHAIISKCISENVTSIAGVPSWMLVLLNGIVKETGYTNLLDLWKNAEVYFHGGVSFSPYKEQYHKLFPDKNFKYYEVYNASEGFFGIQDRNNADDMLLMLDYGIFYEFIPVEHFKKGNYSAIPLWEVEENKNYAIVITTNSGLWRYLLGDTVRFTSTKPHRIKVTGRTKHFINVFGEEVMVENTDTALRIACSETNSEVVEYTVAPIFMENQKSGGHEWLIEFKKKPTNLNIFTKILDQSLKSLNSDYEAKRYKDITLSLPKINAVEEGIFYKWLKENGKLGGQHKVPRLFNSRKYMNELLLVNKQKLA